MRLKLIGALTLLALGIASVAEAEDRTAWANGAFIFCARTPVCAGDIELPPAKLEVPHHHPRVGVLCGFALGDGCLLYLLRGPYPVQVHVPVLYSAPQSSLNRIYRRTFVTEHDDIGWRRYGLRAPHDNYRGQDRAHGLSPWLNSLKFPKKPQAYQAGMVV